MTRLSQTGLSGFLLAVPGDADNFCYQAISLIDTVKFFPTAGFQGQVPLGADLSGRCDFVEQLHNEGYQSTQNVIVIVTAGSNLCWVGQPLI
jgi:hypothetical protein